DLPPWFSVLSIALNSNVDLDVSRIETAPQSMFPIICFRDGSPPLPDSLSMTNSVISDTLTVSFCSCNRNHGGFDCSIEIVTHQDGKIRYIHKSRYFDNIIRQINDGKNYLEKKEVLLGDMGAGKTSLVLRFGKGQFSEYQVTLSYCIFLIYYMAISVGNGLTLFYVEGCRNQQLGAAFFTQVLSLNEATVKFDIWDTVGQERYHSLAPMYYRGAAAAIVVYDITSMEYFARAKKCVQQVQRHANLSLIMFLVANKADLGAERKVTNEEGEEYAKENGLFFLETSAKTAQNVNELLYEIAKRLAKANPSHQTGIKLHSILQETKRRSLFCCV
ncbi:hypothetical protein S83_063304, partial [Arachis hypogaea]